MSKISKYDANAIANAAVGDAMKAKLEANLKALKEAGLEVWKEMTPKDVQAWLAKAPQGWLARVSEFGVRCTNGCAVVVYLPEPLPINEDMRYSRYQIKNAELSARVFDLYEERTALRKKGGEDHRALQEMILAAGTYKKLELAWPEGRAYYASYLNAANKTGTAVAVQFAEINKKLGLPKDETPKAEPKKVSRAKKAA